MAAAEDANTAASMASRQRSMKHRAFTLYARRLPDLGSDPMPASKPDPQHDQSSEVPAASDSQPPGEYSSDLLMDPDADRSNHGGHTRSGTNDSDLPPQIPQIPISPRWDSLSNASKFIYQKHESVAVAAVEEEPSDEPSGPLDSSTTNSLQIVDPAAASAVACYSETTGQSLEVANAAGVRGIDNSKQSQPETAESRASVSTTTAVAADTASSGSIDKTKLDQASKPAAAVPQDRPTSPQHIPESHENTPPTTTSPETKTPELEPKPEAESEAESEAEPELEPEHEIGAPRIETPTPPQPSGEGSKGETMSSIGNFSRPRRPSLKQPTPDAANQYHVLVQQPYHPEPSFDDASFKFSWPRARGVSVSSAKSFAIVSNVPPAPLSAGIYESRAARMPPLNSAPLVPAPLNLSRPSPPYAKVDSSSAGNARDPRWPGAGESRLSVRSQNTSSSAHLTYTERSSVLTKGTSITSMYATMDEPSVEDVMGMYEKGFGDDSDLEEMQPPRPQSATSEYSLREASIPPLATVPTVPTATMATTAPMSIPAPPKAPSDDYLPIFDARPLSTSVPKDIAMSTMARRTSENRDSAKSMGECDESIQTEGKASALKRSSDQSGLEDPDSRDRYGFKKANQYITRERYDDWNEGYTEYLERRRKKWVAYMKESSLPTHEPNRFPLPGTKTKRFIRKGIPPEWRGAAWFYYAHGPQIMGKHVGVYDEMVRRKAKDTDVDAIEKDLDRTFPDNIRFRPNTFDETGYEKEGVPPPAEPEIISSLRRVLQAFSIYNPNIGYCQSLNFIAGLLLLFVETEEQAFWLLNVITRTYLPGTHDRSLEGSQIDLSVLMKVLEDSMPQLCAKLTGDDLSDMSGQRPSTARSMKKPKSRKKGASALTTDRLPPITLTMTAWFMSCFIGSLPIETVLRVWDVFFYENSKTMFRIALAILKQGEDEINGVTDPMEMFSVVQAMPRRMLDANELLEACFKRRNGFGHLSQATVDQERRDRKEKAEMERRRIAGGDIEVKRKGTLFGRKKKTKVEVDIV